MELADILLEAHQSGAATDLCRMQHLTLAADKCRFVTEFCTEIVSAEVFYCYFDGDPIFLAVMLVRTWRLT